MDGAIQRDHEPLNWKKNNERCACMRVSRSNGSNWKTALNCVCTSGSRVCVCVGMRYEVQ